MKYLFCLLFIISSLNTATLDVENESFLLKEFQSIRKIQRTEVFQSFLREKKLRLGIKKRDFLDVMEKKKPKTDHNLEQKKSNKPIINQPKLPNIRPEFNTIKNIHIQKEKKDPHQLKPPQQGVFR